MKKPIILSLTILSFLTFSCKQNKKVAPVKNVLTSWANSDAKNDILKFVASVTDKTSEAYVAPINRIAVFDLDGTVICEKPSYSEVAFSVYHLKRMAENDSTLAEIQPYKAALENDNKYLQDSVDQVLVTPFIGYSQKQYTDSVLSYFKTVKNDSLDITYEKLFYKPMVDLIAYLKQNNFKVYVSSYTQQSFIRSITPHYLGLDKEHSIGSIVDLEFETIENKAAFVRQDNFILKNSLKAEVIEYQIGQAPIFVAGNSGGDIEMLNYANLIQSHMVLIIDHDDGEREFEYHDTDLLKMAKEKNWTIISMKNDFKTLFQK